MCILVRNQTVISSIELLKIKLDLLFEKHALIAAHTICQHSHGTSAQRPSQLQRFDWSPGVGYPSL